MSLVVAEDLTLAFGTRKILDGAGLRIGAGERIGLVGPNGSGKTTLLRVLAGETPVDRGSVTRRSGSRTVHLPQDVTEFPSGPLLDSVLAAVPGRAALEQEVQQAERHLGAARDEDGSLAAAQRLADAHEALRRFEERFSRHRAERILEGLGFQTQDLRRPIAELSGGWRMRALLAGMLFAEPDLLLLDEPTNHLDLPSVRWLAGFLRGEPGAVVLVSHDREFLNGQVDRILAFEVEGLRAYRGTYDDYLRQRAEEEQVLRAAASNQERERRQAERFITRFRAKASKARAVQSRIKRLEKLEPIVLPQERARVRFRFPAAERAGEQVIAARGIAKRFGERVVFEGLEATVRRGDRIAVVGRNGVGKTTLLRVLAGELAHEAGEVRVGHNVTLAYYAQHHAEALDASRTILAEVGALVPSWTAGAVRNVLGAFLFSGDEVEKPIGVLSGGERARVALAKLLVRPGNLLLMDEPTNHLDIGASEALADALGGYGGTLVFVSHNLAFGRRLSSRVWDLRESGLIDYPGTLGEYLEHLERTEDAATSEADAAVEEEGSPSRSGTRRGGGGKRRQAARPSRTSPGAMRRRVEELETRIEALEAEQRELEASLADPETWSDAERGRALGTRHQRIREELEALTESWEAAAEDLRREERDA